MVTTDRVGETELSKKIDVTLMRHGRSRADDEKVHEGRYDSPLTDTGREQVLAQAKKWKRSSVTFDTVVSSTLSRASESAQIVSDLLGVPAVEYDADWIELDNGPFAGLPFDVAQVKYPRPDFANPYEPFSSSTGEGEGGWDLYTRAAHALQRVVRRGPGSYLVVAHGAIINAALCCILGISPPAPLTAVRFAMGDACFVRTSYAAEKNLWTILEMSAQRRG